VGDTYRADGTARRAGNPPVRVSISIALLPSFDQRVISASEVSRPGIPCGGGGERLRYAEGQRRGFGRRLLAQALERCAGIRDRDDARVHLTDTMSKAAESLRERVTEKRGARADGDAIRSFRRARRYIDATLTMWEVGLLPTHSGEADRHRARPPSAGKPTQRVQPLCAYFPRP
jgi:hypothetical protein